LLAEQYIKKFHILRNNLPLTAAIFVYVVAFLAGLYSQYIFYPVSEHKLTGTEVVSLYSILRNNFTVITYCLLGGFILGAPTAYNIALNGFLAGTLFNFLKHNTDLNLISILLLTLPHGIFEIPAIIIAGAAGFKIPYEVIRYLAGKKEQILTKEDIKEYFTLALISIILIVIAAWIEANITMRIAKAMLKTKGI